MKNATSPSSPEEPDDDEYFRHLSKMQRDRVATLDYSVKPVWMIKGSLGDAKWITKGATEDDRNQTIYFEHSLPDGRKLTDPLYSQLLISIQKNAIALRSGRTGATVDPYRWSGTINWQKNLSSWLVLHSEEYNPRSFGFKGFDDNAVKILMTELAVGNWANALQYTERFLTIMHKDIYGTAAPDHILTSPFELPGQLIQDVSDHLIHQGHLTKNLISRNYLAALLTADHRAFKNIRFRAFLSQFEDDVDANFVLVGHSHRKRNAGHKHLLHAEAVLRRSTQSAFVGELSHLTLFSKCNALFPELIPKLNIDRNKIFAAVHESLVATRHTRKIPLSIGISLLTEATEWIMRFGGAFVDAIVFYANECKNIDEGSNWCTYEAINNRFHSTKSSFMTQGYDGYPCVPLVEALNISTLNSSRLPGMGLSFVSGMQGFIGACLIILSMLKPLRVGEVCRLPRDCLEYEDLVGGALINHVSEKSGHAGANDTIVRPIPYIAARAIQLLQLLGTQLEQVFQTSPKKKLLFYFPNEKGLSKPGARLNPGRIDACLNAFCSILGRPKDEHGRSWLIRIHEARKFYLMTLIHHEGESSRTTGSYMAGHMNTGSVDEYLSGDIPTDELLNLKAECITEKLIKLEQENLPAQENQGLVALHAEVKRRFNVDSIRGRSHKDYDGMVRQLLANKSVELQTYTITIKSSDGVILDNEFAVKYLEHKDEKFKN